MGGSWRDSLVPGSVLGDLRVERRLGSGGMGEVFLASHVRTGEIRAVKVVNPEIADTDPAFSDQFIREAEFLMRTRHPNLVPVFGAERDSATGLYYLVMEFEPGGSLRDRLQKSPGGLPFDFSVKVFREVLQALVQIEESGMVHRDVKPDNVLFGADGTARLADLGASRFMQAPDAADAASDKVIGTPAYMAPEQMIDSRRVDTRADLYSLGLVVYEMLAGSRPNTGEGAMCSLAKAIGGRSFPDVRESRPDVSPALAVLVNELLLPDADERPRSAALVLELFENPDRILSAEVPVPAAPSEAVPWYRDRRVLYAGTAMLLTLEALGLALFRIMGR